VEPIKGWDNELTENVKISFEDSYQDDPTPVVVVYNPQVMSPPLLSQVMRFGLASANARTSLSGKLKGSRKALIEMIQSYGVDVQIVRAP
jgi:hypothetical protein